MPLDLTSAIVVDFPLRGEWRALNTPADRVPSHGTDYFGQRYGIDFVRFDAEGLNVQPGSIARQMLGGVPVETFFSWDQPVHAAFAGRVISAGDGWPDRSPVSTLREIVRATFFAQPPAGRDYRPLAGNFLLVEGEPGVALYAHLRSGSLAVREGDRVDPGMLIGRVGNSGNTTMPHLHFHVMDGPDPFTADGRLVAFRGYRRFENGSWIAVERGVPGKLERIRSVAD